MSCTELSSPRTIPHDCGHKAPETEVCEISTASPKTSLHTHSVESSPARNDTCGIWASLQGATASVDLQSMPLSRWNRVTKYVVDPRRSFHKYFLLCLLCLFIPGPYYFDALLATYKTEMSDAMSLSNEQFGLLFAFPSLTGIACGPAGLVVMRLGEIPTALGAGLVCSVGSLFTALGFHWGNLGIMLVARLFFWLALYMLLLVQTLLVYSIFTGKELAVSYGLIVTFMRAGSVGGYFLSGPVLGWFGVLGSLFVAVGLVFIGFGATILFAFLYRGTRTAQTVRPLLSSSQAKAKPFSLTILKEVPKSVVALSVAIGTVYGIVFPFEVVADDMLQKEFGFNPYDAGYLLTSIPMVAVLSPFFSPFLGNTIRKKIVASIVSMGMLAAAQFILFKPAYWSPFVAFGLMGIGYTVGVCSLWTLLPLLVNSSVPEESRKNVESFATGLNYTLVAICQFISNLAVGAIKDAYSYNMVCVYFLVFAIVGMLSVAAIIIVHAPRALVDPNEEPPNNEVGVVFNDDVIPTLINEGGLTSSVHEHYYDS